LTFGGVRGLIREHRWFVGILALGVVLRLATVIAYRPLLMRLTDTWGYLSLSWNLDIPRHFVIAPDRPFGYPLFLWILARPFGFHAIIVTGVQHLAGLITGTLAYATLVRLGVRRLLAVIAAAIILLDTYAIALEHTILAESIYTVLLMAAAFLVVVPRSPLWAVPVAGLLLGAAGTLRLEALVAVLPWLAYVIWRHWRRPALIGLAVLGFAIPTGAYAIAHHHATGRFGFEDAGGTFLYGRVAGIADCSKFHVPAGTRALCQPKSQRVDNPGAYIWDPQYSPARKLFPGGWGATAAQQHSQDQVLGRFAKAVIRGEPVQYLGLAGRDFLRFFEPGIQPWEFEADLALPPAQNPDPGPLGNAVWPSYRNQTHWPAPVLSQVSRVFRTPRWLLGVTTLVAFVNLFMILARAISRRPLGFPRKSASLVFNGIALITLVAAAATSLYRARYMVSVAPLLVVGGTLAVEDALAEWKLASTLVSLVRPTRVRPAPVPSDG
jgi:hypothetical protein